MGELFLPTLEVREKKREELLAKSDRLSAGVIGNSILGRSIDVFRIGEGARHVLFVGAHHAMEYITATALYDLIEFLCEKSARGGTHCGVSVEYFLKSVTVWIVPCLNPDGVDMNLGAISDSPLFARQIKMNGDSTDFSEWQANARGVDLNHNYNYRFFEYKRLERERGIFAGRTKYSGEYPESEPETRALASFTRALMPTTVISFHTQGGEVFYMPKTDPVRRKAEVFCRKTGYMTAVATDTAEYGGLCDYTGGVLNIPSFTVELGRGKTPLPPASYPAVFEAVRAAAILLSAL